ncbi:MAG: MOSC domain-containing protein [Novosphingobium sp.]|uniref:MOSC domain-containing protein n=1 Tax=Novosphingobium sp. TaxID=1874826 RepID=UPI001DF5120E|nr:MOSC domain-containing protein [Novosphingobium sp.]MCB2058171.1 MOSC domain-containing protein [Novosphingobium sp.]MCP5387468.1 MOSC domain-containing protein [Novosphingobium sp.]
MSRFTIRSINIGKTLPFRDGEASAISKRPCTDPVAVTPLGLAGDEQADRVHHGGVDMAIHHYPHDHYAYWQGFVGDHPLLADEGAFGENISTSGLTEAEACIGDRYRLGTALVEISQARQPCWKLGHRFSDPRVTAEVVKTGYCGWYYRVIEQGSACAGDTLELIARPHPDWSVGRAFDLLVAGGHKRDPGSTRVLADLDTLSAEWRRRAAALG